MDYVRVIAMLIMITIAMMMMMMMVITIIIIHLIRSHIEIFGDIVEMNEFTVFV